MPNLATLTSAMTRRSRTPMATNILLATSVLLATSILLPTTAHSRVPTPPPTDAELMHQALVSCKGLSKRRRKTFDLGLFRALLDLEERAGVPTQLRGMTLAKACIESGYTPDAKGDCGYGSCKALGVIQLWPWTLRFGVDRTDPIDSVRFLLSRVKVGVAKLSRRCPRVRGEINRFVLAWLRINRGPLRHHRQRCSGTPHGLRRLRQWHRNIAKTRRLRARAERRASAAVRRSLRARVARVDGRHGRRERRRLSQTENHGYNAASNLWALRPVRRNYP